jgi:hypothetical protein
MKVYRLEKPFRGYEKGTKFYLIVESEFIGVKEFVLRTMDLTNSLSIGESDFDNHFKFIKEVKEVYY